MMLQVLILNFVLENLTRAFDEGASTLRYMVYFEEENVNTMGFVFVCLSCNDKSVANHKIIALVPQ